jgi:hypothetical protein
MAAVSTAPQDTCQTQQLLHPHLTIIPKQQQQQQQQQD